MQHTTGPSLKIENFKKGDTVVGPHGEPIDAVIFNRGYFCKDFHNDFFYLTRIEMNGKKNSISLSREEMKSIVEYFQRY